MSEDIVPQKQCTKCREAKPATSEYFSIDKKHTDGLRSDCKDCRIAYNRAYYARNRERLIEASSQYSRRNNDQHRRRGKAYRARNQQALKVKKREHYLSRHEHYVEQARNHRLVHKDRLALERRARYKNNPASFSIRTHNYRARKYQLPDTFTPEQWASAINYFHGCCAVCGRQTKDLFGTHTIATDHWIPLTHPDCPGTVVTNIVPLCHGEGGCNNSKNNRLPHDWLEWRYGKRKAQEILRRIEAYFEWTKHQ